MGIFVCREFARRRLRVIGFDQFDPPHDRGSHTGDTRVSPASAYAEHPDYVPLAHRAGALWDQLGAEEGAIFLHRTGMLSIGEPDSWPDHRRQSQCGGTRSDARLSVAGRGTHKISGLQAAPGVECAVRACGRLDRCGRLAASRFAAGRGLRRRTVYQHASRRTGSGRAASFRAHDQRRYFLSQAPCDHCRRMVRSHPQGIESASHSRSKLLVWGAA